MIVNHAESLHIYAFTSFSLSASLFSFFDSINSPALGSRLRYYCLLLKTAAFFFWFMPLHSPELELFSCILF